MILFWRLRGKTILCGYDFVCKNKGNPNKCKIGCKAHPDHKIV